MFYLIIFFFFIEISLFQLFALFYEQINLLITSDRLYDTTRRKTENRMHVKFVKLEFQKNVMVFIRFFFLNRFGLYCLLDCRNSFELNQLSSLVSSPPSAPCTVTKFSSEGDPGWEPLRCCRYYGKQLSFSKHKKMKNYHRMHHSQQWSARENIIDVTIVLSILFAQD